MVLPLSKSPSSSSLRSNGNHDLARFLNNVGVEQLRRHCYSQALLSFQDAFSLWTSSSVSSQQQRMIRRANLSLANPRVEDLSFMMEILEARRSHRSCWTVHFGSSTNSNECALQEVLQSVPTSSVTFPVRLEGFGGAFCKRQKAVVAHNLSIAYFSMHTIASMNDTSSSSCHHLQNQQQKQLFLERALRFAETASQLLVLNGKTSDAVAMSGGTSMMCLSLVMLNSRLQLLQETKRHEQAMSCYELLGEYRNMACDALATATS